MNEEQRENVRKAIAILTAMDADRDNPAMSTKVVMDYIKDSTVVLPDGQVDLGAIDLISGLSMLATGLLAMVEEQTGLSRSEVLRGLATRLG